MLKVALFGQSYIAADILAAICERPAMMAICTVTEDNGEFDPLVCATQRLGVQRFTHTSLFYQANVRPDIIVCAHFYSYLPELITCQAVHGAIGYHPSLLPRHRGRDSVNDTVKAGDALAGGTIYRFDDDFDTGPIIAQASTVVDPKENAGQLWRRALAPMGVMLMMATLDIYAAGFKPVTRTQPDRTEEERSW